MICKSGETMVTLPDKQESSISYLSYLVKTAWITMGAALLVVMLFLSLGHIRVSETAREFLFAFVYSASIALPSMFVLTWVSHRYSEQYPRLIIPVQALLLACIAVIGCLAGDVVLMMIGLVPRNEYWLHFKSAYRFSVVIAVFVGMAISSYETLRFRLQATVLELRTKQVEQERAYKLLAEARLSSLESRIHPHFLFNTLNSIASLIPSDPQRAEDTVARLASLLRFSLNASHSGLVPLGQELKIVRDYLEIEHTRFGSRLRYVIAVPESLDAVKVPPLSLQTLVENSVKHVIAQRPQGGEIRIAGSTASGRILLEVTDEGPGFSMDSIPDGHGLANLVARIQLLFGNAGNLTVVRQNDGSTVRLSFPAPNA
jgi:sensor histidine kinase YesM